MIFSKESILNSHDIYGGMEVAYPEPLVVALAFSHYVCHFSVVHFSIQMTTGISNLKLRQTCIQKIDASLHEQRNRKTDQLICLNIESLAMWWKPRWQSITNIFLFYRWRRRWWHMSSKIKVCINYWCRLLFICSIIELF